MDTPVDTAVVTGNDEGAKKKATVRQKNERIMLCRVGVIASNATADWQIRIDVSVYTVMICCLSFKIFQGRCSHNVSTPDVGHQLPFSPMVTSASINPALQPPFPIKCNTFVVLLALLANGTHPIDNI